MPSTVMTYSGASTLPSFLPAVDSIGATSISIDSTGGSVTANYTDISSTKKWQGSGSNYSTVGNWGSAGVQNGTAGQAFFADANAGSVVLDAGLPGNLTLSSLIFNNATTGYTLSATGGKSLILDSTIAANAQINDMAGSHLLNSTLNVVLNKNLRVNVAGTLSSGTITDQAHLTIDGVISGTGGITQQGLGILTLNNPNNSYSGPTVMKYADIGGYTADNDWSGVLEVAKLANGGSNSSIGKSSNAPENLVLTGVFRYTGTTDVSIDRGFTCGSYLYFDTGAKNIAMSGQVTSTRSGNFYKIGSGALTLSNDGANLHYGDMHVREGSLIFDGTASTTWKLETGGTNYSTWNGAWFCVGEGESTANVSAEIHNGSFDINGAVLVGMEVTGGTTSTLKMTGGKIDAIYLSLGDSNGAGGYNSKPVLDMSGSSNMTLHYAAYIAEDAGSDATLTMKDNAVLDTSAFVLLGYYAGAKATATLEGNSQLTIQTGEKTGTDLTDYRGLNIGYHGNATVTVKGNASITTAAYLPTAVGTDANSQGVLNIQENANLTIGSLRVGERDSAVGVVRQSGGSISSLNGRTAASVYGTAGLYPDTYGNPDTNVFNGWTIGGNIKNDKTAWSTTSYGYYGLSGGTMSPGATNYLVVGYTGAGIFDQTGGTLYNDFRVRVAELATSTGVANIGGNGIVTTSNPAFASTNVLGVNGYGVMNLSGSGQFIANAQLLLAQFTGSTGILNVGVPSAPGGTVNVTTLGKGVGTAAVNFHGGTMKAQSAQSNWIGMDSTVYGEGAQFDTNGKDVTISNKLLAPTGKGVSGISLTDGGAGYIAPPVVKITTTGTGSGATANAVVDLATGKVTGFVITNPGQGYAATDTLTVSFIGGGATTAATATIPAANLVNNVNTGGVLKTGLGTLTLSGLNTYAGDTYVNQGALTLTNPLNTPLATVGVASGSTLTVPSIVADSLVIGGGPFVLGSVVDAPVVANASVVPEPGTLVLLAMAGLGALLAAWRRK
jgi:autotransporter-associated beta strand protein